MTEGHNSTDAELLAAYAELHACEVAWLSDPRRPAAGRRRVLKARKRMLMFMARTPAGIAVMVLTAMRSLDRLDEDFLREWDGYSQPDACEEDDVLQLLWTIVESAGQLARRRPAGQKPDTFADTVAGFASEGTASLALPGAPTDAMVIAGAEAAGCTPEDLRRGYDAMVAAYAQERAA